MPSEAVAGAVVDVLVVAAVVGTILLAFVVVPELLERRGHDPRSGRVRAVVWLTFLAVVLGPAAATGYLFHLDPLAWGTLAAALLVAALFDYYRLNPSRVPWARRTPPREKL